MEEDRVLLCQALHQSIRDAESNEMHEKLREVLNEIGANMAGQKVVELKKLAWRKSLKEEFFFAKERESKPQTGHRLCVKAFCQSGGLASASGAPRKSPMCRGTLWTTRGQTERKTCVSL